MAIHAGKKVIAFASVHIVVPASIATVAGFVSGLHPADYPGPRWLQSWVSDFNKLGL